MSNISAQDQQLIQTGSSMAVAAYGNTPPPGWVPLIDPATDKGLVITATSGFQAQAYINSDPNDKRIFVAVAGTNDSNDVAAWISAVTGWDAGASQFRDGIDFAAKVNSVVKNNPQYSGYSISTSGHSFGEGFAQMFAYTFGWSGVGYDGVGAGAIIGSAGFTQYLTSQNITAVGGTNFISCNTAGLFNTSGLLSPGGGLVGSIGGDIQGTRQCTVNVEGGLFSAIVDVALGYVAGPLGYAAGKVLSGGSHA